MRELRKTIVVATMAAIVLKLEAQIPWERLQHSAACNSPAAGPG